MLAEKEGSEVSGGGEEIGVVSFLVEFSIFGGFFREAFLG